MDNIRTFVAHVLHGESNLCHVHSVHVGVLDAEHGLYTSMRS